MRQQAKGTLCNVCEYAMGYLDKFLVKPNVEAEIENKVKLLCNKLPSAISNEVSFYSVCL